MRINSSGGSNLGGTAGRGFDPTRAVRRFNRAEVDFLTALARMSDQSVTRSPEAPVPFTTSKGVPDKIPKKIRVAAFAFNMPPPMPALRRFHDGTGALHGEWKRYQLVHFGGEEAAACAERMTRVVEQVLADHNLDDAGKLKDPYESDGFIHFVLLNELALSFTAAERDPLLSEWKRLAWKYRVYILPGTYHCEESFFGVAPAISPDLHRGEIDIQKQNSAIHALEIIRTPDIRMLRYFHTDYGNFMLWICLDLYDPGLIFKLAWLQMRHRRDEARLKPGREIHLLFVPSYNPRRLVTATGSNGARLTDEFSLGLDQQIERLSRVASVGVVAVNSFAARSKHTGPLMETFACLGDSVAEPPNKARSGLKLLDLSRSIHPKEKEAVSAALYEFDLEAIHRHQVGLRSGPESGASSEFMRLITGQPGLEDSIAPGF